MNRKTAVEMSGNDEMLFCDSFDQALIGYVRVFGKPPLALYDYHKCIDVLTIDGMTEEEAIEYLEFNTLGAYVGEGTPAFAVIGRNYA